MTTTAAAHLKAGMALDTDAGPREIVSAIVSRAPLSGDETVTITITGYPHPIHLKPTERLNVA